MNELDQVIRDLTEKTDYSRYQFVMAELESCRTSLDMAKFELSIGNMDIAKRELDAVEKGIRTLDRFLPQTRQNQREELEGKVTELKAAFQAVRQELKL